MSKFIYKRMCDYHMADYKNMYMKLYNSVTDAIDILQKAQLETEELFISQDESNITQLKKPDDLK